MIEALADRILIKPHNPELPLHIPGERVATEGEVVSIGPACKNQGKDVKQGDKVVFKRSLHDSLDGLIILREDQILATIA